MYDMLIQNGLIVLENEVIKGTLGIKEGKITAILKDGCDEEENHYPLYL